MGGFAGVPVEVLALTHATREAAYPLRGVVRNGEHGAAVEESTPAREPRSGGELDLTRRVRNSNVPYCTN